MHMKISIQTTDMSYSYVMLQKNYTKVGVINERTKIGRASCRERV